MYLQPAFLLDQLVARAAAHDPDAPAVCMEAQRLTYGELEARVQAVAAGLASAGVRPGDRVGLYMPKHPEAVAALLGILRAGAAYVPVDPQAPVERVRFILEHCGVKVLFAGGRPLKQLAAAGKRVADTLVVPDDCTVPTGVAGGGCRLGALGGADVAPVAGRTEDDLAYVLYTSGSTGLPKGVAITHGQSLAFVRTATEIFGLHAGDTLASHAPFNFDLSIIDLFCTFLAGAQVALLPEAWLGFPAKVADFIAQTPITVWNSVPSALVGVVNRGQLEAKDLSRLRLIMFAGEPFPLPALRGLRAAVPEATLLNVYGQTEANSSTYHRIDEIPADGQPLPIGRPFPNYDVLVMGDDGRAVTEPGVPGELYVVGPAVASGYYADPERTAAAFVQHPLRPGCRQPVYRTGDRAAWDEAGRLVFKGRADHAVKVRGFRVELAEIESVARQVTGVADACAAAVPEDEVGHRLVLFVAEAPGQHVDEEGLRHHLAEILPKYMRPERVALRASLPRTTTGKVDRPSLNREAKALLTEG
ncbi:MAG: amino acid adenylation domain-containing protein [Myxococcales bacterium]|nr:amino acid adenylation domain-containing protein [Myxococcales bacterium]MCB9646298.1 amino acid adenylation domain-containing protein [Deltaproteobacteria bacterium]